MAALSFGVAINKQPGNPEPYLLRAHALSQLLQAMPGIDTQHTIEEIIGQILVDSCRMISLKPDARNYFNTALFFHIAGMSREADEFFKRAIKTAQDEELLMYLGRTVASLGKVKVTKLAEEALARKGLHIHLYHF